MRERYEEYGMYDCDSCLYKTKKDGEKHCIKGEKLNKTSNNDCHILKQDLLGHQIFIILTEDEANEMINSNKKIEECIRKTTVKGIVVLISQVDDYHTKSKKLYCEEILLENDKIGEKWFRFRSDCEEKLEEMKLNQKRKEDER